MNSEALENAIMKGGNLEAARWEVGGNEGRRMNRSDKGLNLSGSWQQGHFATYNIPFRI